jgi:hypothetical protein
MTRILTYIAVVITLASCTDNERTIETLTKSGFTNVTVGGYAAFGCSDDDHFATEFTATNQTGHRVSGVVCCGLMKSCTVRF